VYDFAKRPLWILSHVLVVVAVLVMLRLGFWQMDRWQNESELADQIEQGLSEEPVPLTEILADVGDDPTAVPEELRFERASVVGTWRAEDEVVVRNRSLEGLPGGWVLTPLEYQDGSVVAVMRGWVPLEQANAGGPVPEAVPPVGEVAVSGIVGLTHSESGLGAKDPDTGTLSTLARVDLERFQQQLDADLAPVWLTMDGMTPPQKGDLPEPVAVDLPTPSQNFSYMVQWFVFATIFAVGYLLILRKVAHSGE
jgi:surfeit locus 1 family protein